MSGNIDLISYSNSREDPIRFDSPRSRFRMASPSTDSSSKKSECKQSKQVSYVKIPKFLEKPYKHEVTIVERRLNYLKRNLLRDIFWGHAFIYPFTGLYELFSHNVYWGPLLVFAACYISVFMVVAVIYYIAIVPLLIAWALISLGPLGIVLGHIQWILQTNAITTMICRKIVLTHLVNQIFDATLYMNGQKEFLKRAKFIKITEKPSSSFWQMDFPLFIVHLIRKGIILIILALLSLIPVFGPPISNQMLSGRRGYSYMGRYFTLKGQSASEAKDFQYEHLGCFFSFGMAAGILEFIPMFSIITITSNTIGAAKWSVDLINKSQE